MAMLAEPRRKQKIINLRAKNNAWSNDSTKFGQRMLEKMGWSSGKGLGAHENGITEHVVAKYKNDERGLGFEDKNDQWTKHEDDFNALLANLSNASDSTENLHSGVSLEDKSKKSKARIHYHKFTRGKDISRYSEKDLANIFGKKSFKTIKVVEEPTKEEIKPTEQVFTDKGSMADYFKNKLAAFKSKSKINIQQNDLDSDEPSYAFRGFSQETDDVGICTGFGFGYKSPDVSCNNSDGNSLDCDSENIKKKKKKSKNKDNIKTENASIEKMQENNVQSEECGEKIKKNKKSKENVDGLIDPSPAEITNDAGDTNVVVKKNKKSKNKEANKDINACIDETICDNEQDLKKIRKKEKKNRKNCVDNLVSDNITEEITNVQKKKRKNDERNTEEAVENVAQVPKKKKKKKVKENNED